MIGFEFADSESGISAALRPSGAAVVFDHDDVLGAGTDASVQRDGEAGVALELGQASLRVELAPVTGPVSLRGEHTGSEELTVCRVLGDLDGPTGAKQISCLGIRTESTSEPDVDTVSMTRSIAIAFGDGGILALRAARPPRAEDHGEEEVVATLAQPGAEPVQFPEALLSTQYDSDGRQVRATLELWPEQESAPQPGRRVAGTIVCGTSLALSDRRLDIAFFRWSMEGRPGLGRYEVLSTPAAS